MKTINTVVAAMALSTLSFGVFAAEPVTASQAQNMNKIGVVSADGASTLDALEAKLVADHLIAANLAGHDSHGIGMIPSYVRSWSQGHLQINHHAKIVKEAGAAVTLDGDRAFGQVAAHEAMALVA